MSDTFVAAARVRLSSLAAVNCVLGMFGAGSALTAHTAAVSTYKPSIDARNGAQGGVSAWSPPV